MALRVFSMSVVVCKEKELLQCIYETGMQLSVYTMKCGSANILTSFAVVFKKLNVAVYIFNRSAVVCK